MVISVRILWGAITSVADYPHPPCGVSLYQHILIFSHSNARECSAVRNTTHTAVAWCATRDSGGGMHSTDISLESENKMRTTKWYNARLIKWLGVSLRSLSLAQESTVLGFAYILSDALCGSLRCARCQATQSINKNRSPEFTRIHICWHDVCLIKICATFGRYYHHPSFMWHRSQNTK